MSKSGATEVNRDSQSPAPARPPASPCLRDGRAREETSLVSSFRRLASCVTESAGSGEGGRRRWRGRTAGEEGAGEVCASPAPAGNKWGSVGGDTPFQRPEMIREL